MADCSAAGTAMDRAASVLMGSSTTNAGKHASTFLGHATVGGGGTAAMPLQPPTALLTAPSSSAQETAGGVGAPAQTVYESKIMMQQQPAQMQMQVHTPQHQQLAMQQMNMMMINQQQQMMQLLQQQQQQQQQQRDELQQQEQQPGAEDAVARGLDDWHEGLEEEYRGLGTATMDELAEAWAQAEREYNEDGFYDDDINLAGAYANEDEVEPEYQFITPEQQHDNDNNNTTIDWMERGLQEFRDGDVESAIRSFEALVRLDDSHAKAWYYLGKCHAEHEMDVQAIACFERSVERDPFSPETLLALGVSYVNELNHRKALESLRAWITHNPKYAGLEQRTIFPAEDLYTDADDTQPPSEFEQVQTLLLRALEHDPSPQVHEALGVVYNVSHEYAAAIDSFRAALRDRPDDYGLWNKLGATQANSSSSEAALPNYHQALQLRPRYARAWLNTAISHSNLQQYHEAARCYLQTLAINPRATHCWSYLRIALSCLERWELLPLVTEQNLAAFQKEFDFVYYGDGKQQSKNS